MSQPVARKKEQAQPVRPDRGLPKPDAAWEERESGFSLRNITPLRGASLSSFRSVKHLLHWFGMADVHADECCRSPIYHTYEGLPLILQHPIMCPLDPDPTLDTLLRLYPTRSPFTHHFQRQQRCRHCQNNLSSRTPIVPLYDWYTIVDIDFERAQGGDQGD